MEEERYFIIFDSVQLWAQVGDGEGGRGGVDGPSHRQSGEMVQLGKNEILGKTENNSLIAKYSKSHGQSCTTPESSPLKYLSRSRGGGILGRGCWD